MEELIERVKASEKTKAVWRKNPKSMEWQEASKLNKILVGIPLNPSSKCECIEDLFFLLKRDNIQKTILQKMEKKFILKAGKLIQSAYFENIGEASSDESMINALKRSPSLIVHFKQVPENWKEICGIEEKEPDKTENPVYQTRKDALNPFIEFVKDQEKLANFYNLTVEEFDALLKEAQDAFEEAQAKQLGSQPATPMMHILTEKDFEENPELEEAGLKVGQEIELQEMKGFFLAIKKETEEIEKANNEDETASFQAKFTFEELDALKISGLRSILAENKIEIPANVSRKAELIDFILKTL